MRSCSETAASDFLWLGGHLIDYRYKSYGRQIFYPCSGDLFCVTGSWRCPDVDALGELGKELAILSANQISTHRTFRGALLQVVISLGSTCL